MSRIASHSGRLFRPATSMWLLLLSAMSAMGAPTMGVHTWRGLAPRDGSAFPIVVDVTASEPFRGWLVADPGVADAVAHRQWVDVPEGTHRFWLYPVWPKVRRVDMTGCRVSLHGVGPAEEMLEVTSADVPVPPFDDAWRVGVITTFSPHLTDRLLSSYRLTGETGARVRGLALIASSNRLVFKTPRPVQIRREFSDFYDLDKARSCWRRGDAMMAFLYSVSGPNDPRLDQTRESIELSSRALLAIRDACLNQPPDPALVIGRDPVITRISTCPLADSALLPDRWYGYQGLDTLWWDADRPSPLTGPQRQALATWVRQGGSLVVAGARGIERGTPPFPVVGLVLSDPPTAVTLGFGRVVGCRLEVGEVSSLPRRRVLDLLSCPPDIEVTGAELVGLDKAPLPADPAAATGAEREALMRAFAEQPALQAARAYRSPFDSSQNLPNTVWQVLDETLGYVHFPAGGLFLLGLVYFATISAFDFFLVRRLRRPLLTWFTWPLYIAVFSVLAWRSFPRQQAGILTRYEYVVIDGDESAGVLRESALGCLLVPKRGTYELAAAPDQLWLALSTYLLEVTPNGRRRMVDAPRGSLARDSSAADRVSSSSPVHGRGFYLRQDPATDSPSPVRLTVDDSGALRLEDWGGGRLLDGWVWWKGESYQADPTGELVRREAGRPGRTPSELFTGWYWKLYDRERSNGTLGARAQALVRLMLLDAALALDRRPVAALSTLPTVPLPPGWNRLEDGRARLALAVDTAPPGAVEPRLVCLRLIAEAHPPEVP